MHAHCIITHVGGVIVTFSRRCIHCQVLEITCNIAQML